MNTRRTNIRIESKCMFNWMTERLDFAGINDFVIKEKQREDLDFVNIWMNELNVRMRRTLHRSESRTL